MYPRKTNIGAFQMVELGLLTDPENPQRQKAHHVHDEPRRKGGQAVPQIVLVVYGFQRGHAQIKRQQGHSEGEDAIAEGREALDALPGNLVVRRGHGAAKFQSCKSSRPQNFKERSRGIEC